MKQKLVIMIIACSLFAAIGGGSILLHGGIRPTSDFARNISSRNSGNDSVGNGSVNDSSEAKSDGEGTTKNDEDAKNCWDVKNSSEANNDSETGNYNGVNNDSRINNDSGDGTTSSVRTMRGNRKDGMDEIGFTLYKEAFVLSESGITDGERLVKTILSNGWKIEDNDILPVMNAAGTMYGTVVESGRGKQEIAFKPDEEVRQEDTIILVVDTGSVPGYKKDYYDYPICGIQICSYRDEFPEVYCNGWEPWMDSDESCAVLGTTNLITSENNADYDELLYVQHPDTYKESGTGNTIRLIFYSDKNTIGEEKVLLSIKTED